VTKNTVKKDKKQKQRTENAKKEAFTQFYRQFVPLLIAFALWIIANVVIHLPAFKEQVQQFFVQFTIGSVKAIGSLLPIQVTSDVSPLIAINGYSMQVVMECTAYNFYLFVFFLSILSPVKWVYRLTTLVIFMLAIFLVNSLRFITLGLIGKLYPDLFHGLHDYVWNILFGILVFLIWLWRYRATHIGKKA
jgi:exosortase/archaeosortase family protein